MASKVVAERGREGGRSLELLVKKTHRRDSASSKYEGFSMLASFMVSCICWGKKKHQQREVSQGIHMVTAFFYM